MTRAVFPTEEPVERVGLSTTYVQYDGNVYECMTTWKAALTCFGTAINVHSKDYVAFVDYVIGKQ